jgi:hypothetical protein
MTHRRGWLLICDECGFIPDSGYHEGDLNEARESSGFAVRNGRDICEECSDE